MSDEARRVGRWAHRAKAAAQQRQPDSAAPSHRPVKPQTPTAPSSANPFLPGSVAPVPVEDPVDVDESLVNSKTRGGLAALGVEHSTGPSAPPVAPAPLNPALRVPGEWPTTAAPGPQGTAVQVVGLLGGAGTSTVAALIGPQAVDCGTNLENLVHLEVPVLFVTRSHAHGLDLALRLGQQFAAQALGPMMVLGICVVQDAPTLSKGLSRTLRSVQKSLPNCWTVPWDEDLRHDPALPPAASRGGLARDVRRIVTKATELRDSRHPPQQESHTEHL